MNEQEPRVIYYTKEQKQENDISNLILSLLPLISFPTLFIPNSSFYTLFNTLSEQIQIIFMLSPFVSAAGAPIGIYVLFRQKKVKAKRVVRCMTKILAFTDIILGIVITGAFILGLVGGAMYC